MISVCVRCVYLFALCTPGPHEYGFVDAGQTLFLLLQLNLYAARVVHKAADVVEHGSGAGFERALMLAETVALQELAKCDVAA